METPFLHETYPSSLHITSSFTSTRKDSFLEEVREEVRVRPLLSSYTMFRLHINTPVSRLSLILNIRVTSVRTTVKTAAKGHETYSTLITSSPLVHTINSVFWGYPVRLVDLYKTYGWFLSYLQRLSLGLDSSRDSPRSSYIDTEHVVSLVFGLPTLSQRQLRFPLSTSDFQSTNRRRKGHGTTCTLP